MVEQYFLGGNFDQTDMRFLDTGISQMNFDIEVLRFEIAHFFNLAHTCFTITQFFC
jgi:hypothetical protein